MLITYSGLVTLWLTVVTLQTARAPHARGPVAGDGRGLATLAVAALPVLLYWPVTQSGWLHDDPSILRHALEYPLLANLYDPLAWRAYSPVNYTPMLVLSFGLDLAAFGIEPAPFYLHQLAALALAAGLGYWLLTRFLQPLFAWLVVVLVVVSPPMAELAQSLMTRHYIEGLAALLAAFVAFTYGQSSGRFSASLLAAGLYLAACLAKEVYVPAVLLFPFLVADRQGRRAWRSLIPIALCAALYAALRLRMLGAANLIAGYGDLHKAAGSGTWAERASALSAQLGLEHWLMVALALLLCTYALWSLLRQREHKAAGFAVAALIVAWAPLLPLFPDIASRSLLLPAAWVYAVGVLGLQRLAFSALALARWAVVMPLFFAAALALSAATSAAGWQPAADTVRARAEWEFIMHGDPAATLVMPSSEPWHYANAGWLRQRIGDGADGPAVCYSPCLCARAADARYYRVGLGAIERYYPDLAACPTFVDVPMGIALRYDSDAGVLDWELLPDRAGRWFYAQVPVFNRSPIPPRGQTPYLLKGPVRLQFFFESEQGWIASSSELRLDPVNLDADETLRLFWSRDL